MSRSCEARDPTCPVARAISVLQEKWVLHIVHTLLDGPRGFNELGREVGGCNPTTLTQRLARLEEVGLVTRSEEEDRGGRSLYRLTDAGEALSEVIEAIHAWSVNHLHSAGPLELGIDLPVAHTAEMRNGEARHGGANHVGANHVGDANRQRGGNTQASAAAEPVAESLSEPLAASYRR